MNVMRQNRRRPADLQPEVCDLCGAKVGHQNLIESDVEGLRGFKICNLHRFERKAAVTPSFNDYRQINPPPYVPDAARQEPIGGEEWWTDPDL